MRHLSTLFYPLCALLICANFSTNQSTGGKETPQINYKGVLISNEDSTGKITNNVENITFSGLYKDIPVYGIPNTPDGKPTLNATYINLDAIEKIRPISDNPRESIKRFDNRDYVEIILTIKTDANRPPLEQHFLIESTRRIFCDVITAAGIALKKEIAIEAISSLTINSFQARTTSKTETEKEKKAVEESAAKKALCAQAKEDLRKLEEESKNRLMARQVNSQKVFKIQYTISVDRYA